MQLIHQQTLMAHIQRLNLNCLCLDFSIAYCNGWQVRNLKALRKGINDLQGLVNQFPGHGKPIPSAVRHKIYDCIFIIAGYSQLFLEHCADELSDDAECYLKTTLCMMQELVDLIEMNKTPSPV